MNNESTSHPMPAGGSGRALLFAFVGGAAAGAIAALLFAPSSGAQTRARLRESGERARRLQVAAVAAKDAFIATLDGDTSLNRAPAKSEHRENRRATT